MTMSVLLTPKVHLWKYEDYDKAAIVDNVLGSNFLLRHSIELQ